MLAAPLTPRHAWAHRGGGHRRAQAGRLGDQRRPRRAHRRAGAGAGPARRPPRRRGPRHVPRGAAPGVVAAVRPAQRDPDAAHLVVVDAGARSVASACSATTSGTTRRASRWSTSSTRPRGTDRRVCLVGRRPAQSPHADCDRRPGRGRQDHRVQHADARPRRDRWLRRAPAQRRRREGARRAARQARRGVPSEEDRPRRRHLRRPARAAGVVRGPGRDGRAARGAHGPAARGRRDDPRGPGLGRRGAPASLGIGGPGPGHRAARPRVHARRPRDDRPSPGAAQRRRRPPRHAGGARGERARGGDPRAASRPCSRAGGRSATRRSTRTTRRRSAASGSSPRSRCSCCSTSARATSPGHRP